MCGKFISLVALIPMLVHSVLGCCWHHNHELREHASYISTPGEAVSAVTHASRQVCSCSSRTLLTQQAADDCNDESPAQSPCNDESCDYHSDSVTIAPQPVSQENWEVAAFTMVDVPLLQGTQLTAQRELCAPKLSSGAGERRALTQVWLL